MDLTELQERIQELAKRSVRERTVAGSQIGSSVGSPGQGMQKRLREMFATVLPDYDFSRLLVMDVGDFVSVGPEGGYDVGISLPVASDIWYLAIGASILPFRGENYQENAAKILGFLEKYLARLDNIKPLKSLQSYKDINTYMNWSTFTKVWESDRVPRVIRETRFETWMFNQYTEFPSKGPKEPVVASGELYSGLLSFPVGPLGVMEVTSIFSESMDDMLKDGIPFSADGAVTIENPDGWDCVTDRPLQGLMSPMTDMKSICPGVHLVEKGYLVTRRDTEYPAEPFNGYDNILPFHSMRYYLHRDAKWPLPGEFIGLLAKPWPTHVWWFQETSPFLYAGNWFETNYCTSGIVKEILQPYTKEQLQTATSEEQQALAAFGAPDHFRKNEGMVGLVYKCVVRGVEICIATSDFCGYALEDRVAILRINDLDRSLDNTKGNFKWKDMEDLIAWEKKVKETSSNLPYIIHSNMMILPMSFYKS